MPTRADSRPRGCWPGRSAVAAPVVVAPAAVARPRLRRVAARPWPTALAGLGARIGLLARPRDALTADRWEARLTVDRRDREADVRIVVVVLGVAARPGLAVHDPVGPRVGGHDPVVRAVRLGLGDV